MMKSIVPLVLFVVGFLVVDFAVSQDCPSNEVLEVASGNVTSPSYPVNYPANQNCSWLLKAPQGKHIKLKINTFHVQDCGYGCTCDYLKIGIGKTSTDRSNKYCQSKLIDGGKPDLSKPIYSIFDKIWLNFHSNNESFNHYKGFYATFEQINYTPPVCPSDAVVYSANNGLVSSPNHPNNYPDSMHCYWLISVSTNSRIKLVFKDFSVEETGCRYDPSSNCTCDYVKVYDGETNATITEMCGYSLPKPVVSNSNKMLIEFFSGSSGSKKGFSANYQLTNDPPTKPNGSAVTSTSAGPTVTSTKPPTTTKGFAVTGTSAGFFTVIITALLTLTVVLMS